MVINWDHADSSGGAAGTLIRAAQYVRMSTEHQKYSTDNQSAVILKYAEKCGFEIVRTYADEGKSGLKLNGRDALKQLLSDIESRRADYTISYAQSLVAASSESQLVEAKKKKVKGLTPEQIARMETEAARLQREFKMIEQDYGADHLDLVLAVGYVARLLSNARVVGYLAQCHPEILAEFQKLNELQKAA